MDKEGSMDLSGAFAKLLENPEALMEVSGIGEKKFAELREYVTVGDENKGAGS